MSDAIQAKIDRLAEIAVERGYRPPSPKFSSDHDYRGRDAASAVDYYQLLMEPKSTALLIIDMQNLFAREGAPIAAPGSDAIVPPINRLAGYFREIDQPVIWAVAAHRSDMSNVGRSRAFWTGLAPIELESDLGRIYEKMDVRESDILVTKPKYSAFWGSDLEAILNTHGIESLVLTGIATDVCVGVTMVDAYHRDYNCVIVSDGATTTTPFQEQSLFMHENYWGRVLTSDEVQAELTALSGAPLGLPRQDAAVK
jgi:ureidoacrylate peracid hydrolase